MMSESQIRCLIAASTTEAKRAAVKRDYSTWYYHCAKIWAFECVLEELVDHPITRFPYPREVA